MVKENHDHGQTPFEAPDMDGAPPAGGVGLRLAALILTATALLAAIAFCTARWLLSGDQAAASSKTGEPSASGPAPVLPLFQGWKKPDLVLLLSGQQHGYLLPCGCSRPQLGGLERRYNLLQLLKERGWTVTALDLGDLAQNAAPRELPNVQGLIKYRYTMMALKKMGYLAVGIGEYEAGLPLKEALDNYSLNEPVPRVLAANLRDKETNFPEEVDSLKVAEVPGSTLKVGVLGVVGLDVAKNMSKDPQLQFDPLDAGQPVLLQRLLQQLQLQGADLRVLLYQGSLKHAKNCAKHVQGFHVIVCLSEADVAPNQVVQVGQTWIITLGHKAKDVGVLGIYRPKAANQPPELRYQRVSLGEEYLTPEKQREDQPIAKLMEEYAKELKNGDYLHKYSQCSHALQVAVPGVLPTYVGSEKCKKCHEPAFEIWKNTPHAHAYQTLADAKHPSLRQYDGECIVCHVTGFAYKSGFTDEERTPRLKDVGCEACHGPASEHVKQTGNAKWHALMNPWKAREHETPEQKASRILAIDKACQKCHDTDNDVHWDFDRKWPKIAHPTPVE